jgi:hypothetical protein
MGQGNGYGASGDSRVRESVRKAIAQSVGRVPPAAANDIAQSISKIAQYLQQGEGQPVARQMAPDLMGAIGSRQGAPPPSPSPGPLQPAASPTPAPSPAPASGGGGPTGRVGEVARATLNAIDFPSFVASLIRGTFQAIVDSSIQQMEAYAELLRNVAGTVDKFMQDNVSDGMARDYVADQYPNLFARDTSSGQPKLTVTKSRNRTQELPSFFQDLGFTAPSEIDDESIEQVIVPATRRFLAESRQRTLATMVMMGINRVVVDDGEIQAKLQFHIDATEAMQMRFEQYKTGTGSVARGGMSPFSSQGVMVNTASLNAQTEMNVRADLTGQVRVKFRSETFPLERFADSAAIQLINSNARVPQAQPAQGAAPAGTPPAAAAPVVATPRPAPSTGGAGPAPAPATPPGPPTTGQQSAGEGWQEDTWEPGE